MNPSYLTASSLVLLTAVLCTIGCGSSNQSFDSASDPRGRARFGNLNNHGLSLTTFDLNGDTVPDQWNYTDTQTGVLVRAERDIDFDGRVDIYEYYDARGSIFEEEMNLDFDRHVDVVRFYRDDRLIRRELGTGFDGSFSMVKYYDATGQVLRAERDTNQDGRIDLWEYFENGELVRVGYDITGDGSPQIMDESPTPR